MIFGGKQAHLAADELRVSARPTDFAEVVHLLLDVGGGVFPVDAHLVGVGRVVTGRAGQVALGEDAVGPFAADRTSPEQLIVGLRVRR